MTQKNIKFHVILMYLPTKAQELIILKVNQYGWKKVIGFEDLTAVVMKSSIFWHIMPHSTPYGVCLLGYNAMQSNESQVDFHWATQHYIPNSLLVNHNLCIHKIQYIALHIKSGHILG
jgi:hypothetical protein